MKAGTAARALATAEDGGTATRRIGILLMVLTGALYVGGDATAKVLMRRYPVGEVVWGRFAFHLLLLLPLLAMRGGGFLRTQRPRLQLTRSLCQIGSTVFFFLAIAVLPLATATTIAFAQPLLITILSVPILGERVGPRRWAAVVAGFVGVVVIIRPVGVVQWAALLPLGTAAASAFYQIATRLVARADPVQVSLFYTALGGAIVASLALPFFWQAPDPSGWALMALTGTLSGAGHFCIIHAYQRAPASVLAPFTFMQLLWATGLGFALFGDLPDGWTLLGALIIVGSGLYVFYRESVLRGEARAS
ncbi:MAG TPA: DMT family transporter [Stellaceae bacterium]|nr:DMT family transporter [Stellaceae bacterium]